jgi:predicted nucleic acid-binding protein
MTPRQRVVFDTNVLVSRVLLEDSEPGRAVRPAEKNARILASAETLEEFRSVLLRPKFDRYADAALRLAFIERYQRIVESISIPRPFAPVAIPKMTSLLNWLSTVRQIC